MEKSKLKVKVRSKDKIHFEGEAFAVSSKNDIGAFDVLNLHANFVTTIDEYVEIWKNRENKIRISIERGILWVKENLVEVFVGI